MSCLFLYIAGSGYRSIQGFLVPLCFWISSSVADLNSHNCLLLLFSLRPYFIQSTLKLSVSAWLSVSSAFMTTQSLHDITVDNCLIESQVLSVLHAVDFLKPDLLCRRTSALTRLGTYPLFMIKILSIEMKTVSIAISPMALSLYLRRASRMSMYASTCSMSSGSSMTKSVRPTAPLLYLTISGMFMKLSCVSTKS